MRKKPSFSGAAVRQSLEKRVLEKVLAGKQIDQDADEYDFELFVLERLLEFPFEIYPPHTYPVRFLYWPADHVRWAHVEQLIRFCELLNQPKGADAGKPIRLLGFQVLIIYCIFGPEDPETRLRAASNVTMTIGRKNGKTALVGLMMLAMLSLNIFGLRAQDMQVGASDREQASITFEIMQNLVLMDDRLGLADVFRVIPSTHKIIHKRTFSKLKCLSSDAYRAHGANPCCVLFDEVGNLPDNRAREFYSVLSTAFGSQSEPLVLLFSTQAPSDSHLFSEFVDAAKESNPEMDPAKIADPSSVGFIFDLPLHDDATGLDLKPARKAGALQEVDPYSEKNWERSNPALETLSGGFRSIADMRKKARQAQKMPSLENAFCNLQLNQRTTAVSPFLSKSLWESCITDPMDDEDLLGAECWGAGDLSVTTDLSANAFVWELGDGSLYARVLPYTPDEGLEERSRAAKVPYATWVRQGHLQATEGRVIDYRKVAEDIQDFTEAYGARSMGFDRYKWDRVKKECAAIGFTPYEAEPGDFWVPIGQGFIGMEPCIAALEAAVLSDRLRIEANPVVTWCASNAVVARDAANNRKFEKAKSYGKIDCVVALAMAVWLAERDSLTDRAQEGGYEDGAELLVV